MHHANAVHNNNYFLHATTESFSIKKSHLVSPSTTRQLCDGGRRSLPRYVRVSVYEMWLRIKIIETTKLNAFSHALNQNLIDCINFAFCCFSETRQTLFTLSSAVAFSKHMREEHTENRRHAFWVREYERVADRQLIRIFCSYWAAEQAFDGRKHGGVGEHRFALLWDRVEWVTQMT